MLCKPSRWMCLRQPKGFNAEMFDVFVSSSEIFVAYVNASLRNWNTIKRRPGTTFVEYVFFAPELSRDRSIASLPIGGSSTLDTRSAFENGASFMLWQHLPSEFMDGLHEGLTEDFGHGESENWRIPAPSIGFSNASPQLRQRYNRKGPVL